MPQLAIHHRESSYSERWIQFCEERGIPFTIVNAFDSDIMEKLRSAQAFLWHFHQGIPRDTLVAKHVVMSAEEMGLKVFPSSSTSWHFDDKVAQKYLLEALEAPLVPTYVFFDLDRALEWIDTATFPKVFKLRKGAGSSNVRLVHDAGHARALARKAFAGGFRPQAGYHRDARAKLREVRRRADWLAVVKRIPQSLRKIRRVNRLMGRESGYLYFQDFIPDNRFDTRVTVIGNRAFGFTRNVRQGDFRASGSGDVVHDLERIDPRCVEIAFEVARRMGSQSLACDFVVTPNGEPLITEVSYGFSAQVVYDCPGHWDSAMQWRQGNLWPQDAILMDLIEDLRSA